MIKNLPRISRETDSIPCQGTKVPLAAEQLSLHTLQLMCHNYRSPQALESVSLSLGFPRQEYWSGLPFPSAGDLPDAGIKPISSHWQADSLPLSHCFARSFHFHLRYKGFVNKISHLLCTNK